MLKMSFLPGELELAETSSGFVLSHKGAEVFCTQSKRMALKRFIAMRQELDSAFPRPEPTMKEKQELLASVLNDIAIDATLRRPPRKRSTARSSRTFGG